MIPEVGATGKFVFTTPFSTLDGVYRIRAETTFKDALVSGVDFVENLYVPAGLQLSDFDTDYDNYLKDRIAVLESVIDSEIVYYVPESIFKNVPDTTVREYLPLVLVVDLGVQKNTQAVLPLLDQISDLVKASLGSTDPLRVVTNPQNKVYLTDTEYTVLEQARADNIEALVPLRVQLHQALEDKTYLAALVTQYENTIAILSQS